MQNDRRKFLINAAALALSYGISSSLVFSQEKKGTRLILLGTRGGPRVDDKGRKNPSTLLLIKGMPYVVDCGYGVTRQLINAGVSLEMLRYFFITHHHSDHNLEYGGVIYNGWASGLRTRIDAYGPPGLEKMTEDFFNYMRFDIDTRIEDEGRPDLRKLVFAHDFDKPGVILENNDVRVTAGRVHHPLVSQAYAFRFDAEDRSIVISGDTTYAPGLIELAKGADVLVHEVMYLPGLEALLKRVPNAARLRTHLLASHTVPEDVGKVATQAGVKTLVLSHFVPGDDPTITDDQWAEDARKHFKGRIIVGKDLMEIEG
jgi:ribonuclease BN (tRNA processing enzyme)